MSVTTTAHLNFRGQAREALEHYAAVFGGEPVVVTYADLPQESDADLGVVPEQVKWGQVATPAGFSVMAYDVQPARGYDPGQDRLFMSVRGDDADEITRYFRGLAEGGHVREELAPSGFSPLYGMVTDRFGITWVLDVAAPYGG
ncbi:VOC family protein [Pseudokineococcus basanitobsidens]|uniref:VOC family protein n=1 Tax=Pseudokineococcus basanitobsidens TaxID=1926649 RepID=A0ABU8RFM7_9ACTN